MNEAYKVACTEITKIKSIFVIKKNNRNNRNI